MLPDNVAGPSGDAGTVTGQIEFSVAIVLKQIIACEKRGGEGCIECMCDKFRVPGSVQERVDATGEIIGTAESIVCKCI